LLYFNGLETKLRKKIPQKCYEQKIKFDIYFMYIYITGSYIYVWPAGLIQRLHCEA